MTDPKRFIVKIEKDSEQVGCGGLFMAAIAIMVFLVLPARYLWYVMDGMFGPVTIRVEVVNKDAAK